MKAYVLSSPNSGSWQTCARCHVTLFGGGLRCRHCRTLLPTLNRKGATLVAIIMALSACLVSLALRTQG